MKRITLLTILTICFISARAQVYTNLNETFDGSCASGSGLATNWLIYNPIIGIDLAASWQCTATNGNNNTPGMQCSGVYNSAFHLDTSYFITPLLNVAGYNTVYLQFDTKRTNLQSDGTIDILTTRDTIIDTGSRYTDVTDSLNPIFDIGLSTEWTTHQINLYSYRDSGNFRVAFRYVSPSTSGNVWYLDNVNLNPFHLNTTQIDKKVLPLTIIGSSTTSQVSLSYSTPVPGKYQLAIYDMMGRQVYNGSVTTGLGTSSYVINGLSLQPGMFCIKIGNDNTYGTTRFTIQ